MSDLISRQTVLDRLTESINQTNQFNMWGFLTDMILDLPSVQPERKTGKWIIRDNPGTGWYRVTCSECGEDVTSTIPMIGFLPNAKPLWDYCPNCGAKMRGEDDD